MTRLAAGVGCGAREHRVLIANAFLLIVSQHGRRFFHCDGRVARFELDERGRLWFVDDYRDSRIYTHYRRGGWRKFSHGGTLLDLCRALADYIMGKRENLPLGRLGPWPPEYCGGDLWGYGFDAMERVRAGCSALEPAP